MVVEDHKKVSDMGRMAMDMLTLSILQSMNAKKHIPTMLHLRFQPALSVMDRDVDADVLFLLLLLPEVAFALDLDCLLMESLSLKRWAVGKKALRDGGDGMRWVRPVVVRIDDGDLLCASIFVVFIEFVGILYVLQMCGM